jgi:hypothetical protein
MSEGEAGFRRSFDEGRSNLIGWHPNDSARAQPRVREGQPKGDRNGGDRQ